MHGCGSISRRRAENQPMEGPVDQCVHGHTKVENLIAPVIKENADSSEDVATFLLMGSMYILDCKWARQKGGKQTPSSAIHISMLCHAWRSLSCLFALLHFMATFCSLKKEVSLRGEDPTHLRAKSLKSVHICFHFWPRPFWIPLPAWNSASVSNWWISAVALVWFESPCWEN